MRYPGEICKIRGDADAVDLLKTTDGRETAEERETK